MKSKSYVVEGTTTAYKVRFSVYKEGSLKDKIMVGLFKRGSLFWDCIEHDLYSQRQPELAEEQFNLLCARADNAAKEGATE